MGHRWDKRGVRSYPSRPVPTRPNTSSSELAHASRPADDRPEIDTILDYLDERIEANGANRPKRTAKARDSIRLMIDRDGRDPEGVKAAIEYATGDDFWRANILSAPKLREKFDQLSLNAQRDKWKRPNDRHARESQFWEDERASMAGLGEPSPTNHLEIEAS